MPPPSVPPSQWDYSQVDVRVGPDEHGRYRFVVGAVKIPHAERTVARSVMATDDDAAERAFYSVHGADGPDDDLADPVGSDVAYTLLLTPAEADPFWEVGQRDDGNLRYLELDRVLTLPPDTLVNRAFPLIDPPEGGGLIGGLAMSSTDGERGAD